MSETKRNYSIDLIRVIAAFGVVAIHVHADTSSADTIGAFFSPLCVPFFFTASLVYFAAALGSLNVQTVLTKQLQRLLIPYLAWSGMYILLLVAKTFVTHGDRQFVAWRILLYGESAVQMYYLPDLLALQAITLGIYILANQFYTNKIAGIILFVCGAAFFWIGNFYQCFGVGGDGVLLKFGFLIVCGYLFSSVINNIQLKPLFVLTGIVLTVWSVINIFMGWQYQILNYPLNITMGGPGLLLIAVGSPIQRLPKWIVNLSRDSYGIYLCHVLFLEAFEFIISKIAPDSFSYTFIIKIAVVILIFTLSALLTNFIRWFTFFRRVLLGEQTKPAI